MLFAIKTNLVQCNLCGQYILADRFLRNSGNTLLNMKFCQLLGVNFYPKKHCEKSKNIEDCLNLTSKWWHWDSFSHKNQPIVMHPVWSIYIG